MTGLFIFYLVLLGAALLGFICALIYKLAKKNKKPKEVIKEENK